MRAILFLLPSIIYALECGNQGAYTFHFASVPGTFSGWTAPTKTGTALSTNHTNDLVFTYQTTQTKLVIFPQVINTALPNGVYTLEIAVSTGADRGSLKLLASGTPSEYIQNQATTTADYQWVSTSKKLSLFNGLGNITITPVTTAGQTIRIAGVRLTRELCGASCTTGYYRTPVSVLNPTGCAQCLPGSYSSTTNASACTLCPAGKYVGAKGANACVDCPGNFFNPYLGASECVAMTQCTTTTLTPTTSAQTTTTSLGATADRVCAWSPDTPIARDSTEGITEFNNDEYPLVDRFPIVGDTITTNTGVTYKLLFTATPNSASAPYCEVDDYPNLRCLHITSVRPFLVESGIYLNIQPDVTTYTPRHKADVSSSVIPGTSTLKLTFHYARFALPADRIWIALDTNDVVSPYISKLVITQPACARTTPTDIICTFPSPITADFEFARIPIPPATTYASSAYYLLAFIVQVALGPVTQYNNIRPTSILAYHPAAPSSSRRAVGDILETIDTRYEEILEAYEDDGTDVTQFSNDIVVARPLHHQLTFTRPNADTGLAIVYINQPLSVSEYTISMTDQEPATQLHTTTEATLFIFSNTLLIDLSRYDGPTFSYVVFDLKPTDSETNVFAIAGPVLTNVTATQAQISAYAATITGTLAFDSDLIADGDNVGATLYSAVTASVASGDYSTLINASALFYPYHIKFYSPADDDDNDISTNTIIIISASIAGVLLIAIIGTIIYKRSSSASYTAIRRSKP